MTRLVIVPLLALLLAGCGGKETPVNACKRLAHTWAAHPVGEHVVFCYDADTATHIVAVLTDTNGGWEVSR